MVKYEYYTYVYNTEGIMGGKVNESCIKKELNCLGLQGWELISTTSTNQGNGYTRSIIFIFKRVIE